MKIRIGRTVLIRAAVAAFAIAAIVWAAASRYSINNAIPAGAQHTQAAVAAPPDGENDAASTTNSVSVEFMNRGYCYAGSHLTDTQAPGGFAKSDNAPRRVRTPSNGQGLFLLAQPGVVLPFSGSPGMRVTLVNQTNDLLAFAATDSRLEIIQEAQDTDDTWKPIEFLPRSWCGNSYHRVFLAPNRFWAFPAPRYKGSIRTKLRFAMALEDGSQLHSNVFDGSVNPSQFTVKQGHAATNIMDPYNE